MHQHDNPLLSGRIRTITSTGNQYRDFVNLRVTMLEGITLNATNIAKKDKEAIRARVLAEFKKARAEPNDELLERNLKGLYTRVDAILASNTETAANKELLRIAYNVAGFRRILDTKALTTWEQEVDQAASDVFGTAKTATDDDDDDSQIDPNSKKKAVSSATDKHQDEIKVLRAFIASRLSSLTNLTTSENSGIDFNRMEQTYVPAAKFFNDLNEMNDCFLKQELLKKYNDILGRNCNGNGNRDTIWHYQQAYDVAGFALIAKEVDIQLVGNVSKFQDATQFESINLNASDTVAPKSTTTDSDLNGFDSDDDLNSFDSDDEDDFSVPPVQDKYRLLKHVGIGIATTIAVAATALYMFRNTEMGSKIIGMIQDLFTSIGNSFRR